MPSKTAKKLCPGTNVEKAIGYLLVRYTLTLLGQWLTPSYAPFYWLFISETRVPSFVGSLSFQLLRVHHKRCSDSVRPMTFKHWIRIFYCSYPNLISPRQQWAEGFLPSSGAGLPDMFSAGVVHPVICKAAESMAVQTWWAFTRVIDIARQSILVRQSVSMVFANLFWLWKESRVDCEGQARVFVTTYVQKNYDITLFQI